MTTDARLSVELPNHPKTKKLIRKLGVEAAWYLVRLILWTASNRSDGDLSGMCHDDIELAIDWSGATGELIAAFLDVGFLEGSQGHLKFHGWAEHNPWAAGSKQRSEKSKWAALCKSIGKVEAARAMPEYALRHLLVVPETAGGMPRAESGTPQAGLGTPKCETSMPNNGTGTAPSPKPLPFPIPLRAALPKERSPEDQILTAENDHRLGILTLEEKDAKIRDIREGSDGFLAKAASA